MEFYEVLEQMNPSQCNMAMTVLEGKYLGEKALFTDHKQTWVSEKEGFFHLHVREIEEIEDDAWRSLQGIVLIDGTKVFCELLGNEKRFVICGGGHVSIPVIQMGLMIGCHITVLEDRPKFADHARRAGAHEVICDDFGEGLKKIEGDEDTFFIVVTRGASL